MLGKDSFLFQTSTAQCTNQDYNTEKKSQTNREDKTKIIPHVLRDYITWETKQL